MNTGSSNRTAPVDIDAVEVWSRRRDDGFYEDAQEGLRGRWRSNESIRKREAEHYAFLVDVAPALVAEVRELRRVMLEYVELHGVDHDDPDCPEDDTCRCFTIANWNAALAGSRR